MARPLHRPKVELRRYQCGQFAKWLADSNSSYS